MGLDKRLNRRGTPEVVDLTYGMRRRTQRACEFRAAADRPEKGRLAALAYVNRTVTGLHVTSCGGKALCIREKGQSMTVFWLP